MRRKHFGNIHVQKCKRGQKCVNLHIDQSFGVKLAVAILKAVMNDKPFDIAIFDKVGKPTIQLTVTSGK